MFRRIRDWLPYHLTGYRNAEHLEDVAFGIG
jgi:hypothetical protein